MRPDMHPKIPRWVMAKLLEIDLREIMVKHNMNITQLADRLGVSRPTAYRYINGGLPREVRVVEAILDLAGDRKAWREFRAYTRKRLAGRLK